MFYNREACDLEPRIVKNSVTALCVSCIYLLTAYVCTARLELPYVLINKFINGLQAPSLPSSLPHSWQVTLMLV